jgi:hypothetical protein
MHRVSRALLVITLALSGAIFSGAPEAWASCNPDRTNDFHYYYDGAAIVPTRGSILNGVQSNIWNYNPYTVTNANSLVYVMLQLGGGVGGNWAQVGRRTEANNGEFTFYQYTDQSQAIHNMNTTALPVNQFNNYKVDLGTGLNNFNMFAGNLPEVTVPADFIPNEVEVSGEIHSLADQMPGAAQLTESLYDQQFREADSNPGTWYGIAVSGEENNTRPQSFGYARSSNDVDIWDLACTGT